VRPLLVLALAPILALGLALSAGSVVPDKPVPSALKPQSLVWSGRVFTDRSAFAHWLSRRDASYRLWVVRHPSASYFHHVPAIAAPKPTPRPATHATRRRGGGGKHRQDFGRILLYLLLGFGIMLAVGGVIRGIPRAIQSFQSSRRRRVLWPAASTNGAAAARRPLAQLAATSPVGPHPPVYAIPRAFPTPPARAVEPARVVPLYIPPEPEPVAAPAAARVDSPEPLYRSPDRQSERQVVTALPTAPRPEPEPTYLAPEPEPTPARETVAASVPATAPTPAEYPALVSVPEPEIAVPGPEPEVELAAADVAASESEPMPEPEPALPPAAPAIEPEPQRVTTALVAAEPEPAPVAEPEPLPEIRVPAALAAPPLAVPTPEVAPEPEPEPEAAPVREITRPLQTSVLPGPAPQGEEWDTCEIGVWQGYFKSQFYARVLSPEGDEYALALSPLFRSKSLGARDEVARAAHLELAQSLLADGWVADGRGPYWWALRFRPGDDQ